MNPTTRFSLLKKFIFLINFVLKFFSEEILTHFIVKKNLQEIAINFFAKYCV